MNESHSIRPIFVVGAPRTGTTMLGKFIGSYSSVFDLQEYSAFFFAEEVAKREYFRVPSPVKDEYLVSLFDHAKSFADKITRQNSCEFFCDSTPWNVLILQKLLSHFPSAIFVFSYRSFEATNQSLKRSRADGYEWAGSNDSDRADLWLRCLMQIRHLPADNVIVFNYDMLYEDPGKEVKSLVHRLEALGLKKDASSMDTFCASHATTSGDRPVIGRRSRNGEVTFMPLPPVPAPALDIDSVLKQKLAVVKDMVLSKASC